MQTPCIIATVLSTKGYSIEWRDVVRPNVLKRDKYRCKHCGLSNRTPYTLENRTRIILDDAWLLESTATATSAYLKQNISNSGVYTMSVYAKAGTSDWVSLLTAGSQSAYFDLANGVLGSATSNVVDSNIESIGNGWYRCIAVFDNTGFPSNIYRHYMVPSASALFGQSWLPTSDTSLFIYGHSWESGSYPTSYIPTYGTSQTRSADDMDTTFSSAIATNGSATIFFHDLGVADSDDINTTSASYRYQASTGNYVSLTTNDTAWRLRVQGGGSSNFKGLNDHPKTSPIKVAVIVSSTHYSIFANGVKEVDNESLTTTGDFSSIQNFITNIQDNTGVRKAVQHLVFPTALTDSECIALTTL